MKYAVVGFQTQESDIYLCVFKGYHRPVQFIPAIYIVTETMDLSIIQPWATILGFYCTSQNIMVNLSFPYLCAVLKFYYNWLSKQGHITSRNCARHHKREICPTFPLPNASIISVLIILPVLTK